MYVLSLKSEQSDITSDVFIEAPSITTYQELVLQGK